MDSVSDPVLERACTEGRTTPDSMLVNTRRLRGTLTRLPVWKIFLPQQNRKSVPAKLVTLILRTGAHVD